MRPRGLPQLLLDVLLLAILELKGLVQDAKLDALGLALHIFLQAYPALGAELGVHDLFQVVLQLPAQQQFLLALDLVVDGAAGDGLAEQLHLVLQQRLHLLPVVGGECLLLLLL